MRPKTSEFMVNPEAEAALAQARTLARSINKEEEFDRIVAAAMEHDFALLDTLLDEQIPGLGGFHETFLPSFAMSALAPIMRDRAAWKRLRDRVFANMEETERRIGPKHHRKMLAVWHEQNAVYAREADPDYVAN